MPSTLSASMLTRMASAECTDAESEISVQVKLRSDNARREPPEASAPGAGRYTRPKARTAVAYHPTPSPTFPSTQDHIMSQYTASVPPGGQVRPEIVSFFEDFYKVTDSPAEADHERYIDMFTEDAKYFMGVNEFSGKDGITKFRHGMWEKVASRSHNIYQLYAFSEGADDLMAYGLVEFEFKDGRKGSADWAAKVHFTKVDGRLKLDFYQVYLDSAAMAKAK